MFAKTIHAYPPLRLMSRSTDASLFRSIGGPFISSQPLLAFRICLTILRQPRLIFLTRKSYDLTVNRKLTIAVYDAQIFRILDSGTSDIYRTWITKPLLHLNTSRVRDCQSLGLVNGHSPRRNKRHVLNTAG